MKTETLLLIAAGIFLVTRAKKKENVEKFVDTFKDIKPEAPRLVKP